MKKREVEPAQLKAGDRVLYVADLGHWHEVDRLNVPVFDFVAVSGPRVEAGQSVDSVQVLTHIDPAVARHPSGYLALTSGLVVKPSRAKAAWPGVIRREPGFAGHPDILDEDGGVAVPAVPASPARLFIDVVHPNGFTTMHLPLETVEHDPTGEKPHSYHTPEESK